jgi:hypothetical protein
MPSVGQSNTDSGSTTTFVPASYIAYRTCDKTRELAMLKIGVKTAITIQIAAAAVLLTGQLTSPAVTTNPSFSCSGNRCREKPSFARTTLCRLSPQLPQLCSSEINSLLPEVKSLLIDLNSLFGL